MLPPSMASLTFTDPERGSDAALVDVVADELPGGRVLVLGSSRPALLAGLVDRGLEVVVVDSSRTALRRARAALGPDSPVLLLADDPRELTVPGGADGALITSAVWRAVLLPTDRKHVLRSVAGELRADGRLLIEVEVLPDPPPATPATLPSGASGMQWWRDDADPTGTMRVRAGDDEVLFATVTPDAMATEISASGFDAPSVTRATGSHRWIAARVAGSSA